MNWKLIKFLNPGRIHQISILTVTLFICLVSCQKKEKDNPEWTFKAADRIQSHSIVDDNVVYFGSNDSNFYAIDAGSGKELWRKKTGHKIRSKAVIRDSIVFVSVGNNLYALNKTSGREVWAFHSIDTAGSGVLDPWDYHTSSPVLHKSEVYVGFGNGSLVGFDVTTGTEKFRFLSQDSSAIRSTVVIKNDIIYYGDWNGRVYAVDLATSDSIWIQRTYETQPYPTFGQINTGLFIHDSILLFGARNPEFQALSIHSGKKLWSHVEESGGWISGDPIVSGDTLFIGGSDNHKLFAMDVYTGEMFWEYTFLFNNFSQPFLKDNHLFFTTGDAYAFVGQNLGNGYLYALNRKNGLIKNLAHFPGNVFTTPLLYNDKVIVGGDDGSIRSLAYSSFIGAAKSFPNNGQGPLENIAVSTDSITSEISFSYTMCFDEHISLSIRNFEGQLIITLFDDFQTKGDYITSWKGENAEGKTVARGYYFFETATGDIVKNMVFPFEGKQ